jgi:hypothetical protein
MPDKNNPTKEPGKPWDGSRNDHMGGPVPGSEHGPWENYATLPEACCSPAEWFLAVAGEDYPEARALSAFEAAVLEEVIAEVDSAEFLADSLVFEPGKPDPRICTEASWTACGFDRFLHGPH